MPRNKSPETSIRSLVIAGRAPVRLDGWAVYAVVVSLVLAVPILVVAASLLLLIVDVVRVRFGLRRALKAQFPDEDLRGTTFYAVVRMLQLRFMRLPKPKVKLGGRPV